MVVSQGSEHPTYGSGMDNLAQRTLSWMEEIMAPSSCNVALNSEPPTLGSDC